MGCQCFKNQQGSNKVIVDISKLESRNVADEEENIKNEILTKLNLSNLMNRVNSSNTGTYFDNSLNFPTNVGDSSYYRKTYKSLVESEKNSESVIEQNKFFERELLNEFNKVRANPLEYCEKIMKFSENIRIDKISKRSFYLINKNTKINLLKGKEAFLSCCEFLHGMNEKIKNKNLFLKNLELREELNFPFPYDDPSKCCDKDYISENIIKLNIALNNKLKIKGFHYDLSTDNAEISLILQIVDDNNSGGKRRNIIFDDKIKYVGISHGKFKNNIFCTYMVFAS